MATTSEKLQRLRPVTFHLKADPAGALQYGLIAEEVAKVYPDLVIRNASGEIDGVRYDELAPLLLNEVQQQQKSIVAAANANAAQAVEIVSLKEKLATHGAQLRDMQRQMSELHAALSNRRTDELLADR